MIRCSTKLFLAVPRIAAKGFILVAALAAWPILGTAADSPQKPPPLQNGMIKVAVVLSDHANVMDIAGPWEVFQDTSLKDEHGKEVAPFQLYTVAPSTAPSHTEGSNHAGMTVTPDYDFAHAPTPDIVVVGAQSGGPGLKAWLQKVHAEHKLVVSICTGAFKLADAGLLDGKSATTHHWYFGDFANSFPQVKLVRQVRYVQADPLTFTAGGLTSGVDLALHLVADRFGQAVAQQTADYMEYQGAGWKSNQGISELTSPVKHQDWSGKLAGNTDILLHVLTIGASSTVTTDIPAQHVVGAATKVQTDNGKLSMTFQVAGHPASFSGRQNAGGSEISGSFVQDGKSYPLILKAGPEQTEAQRNGSNAT